jgi:hypothetical protein
MYSLIEIVLWLAPSGILVLIVVGLLGYFALNRPGMDEYRRLSERVRHLEANHIKDLDALRDAREEIFYLGRLISMLAELMQAAGLILPDEVDEYMARRRKRPPVTETKLGVLVQRSLHQHFDLAELEQLAFVLGIVFEDLPGATKEQRSRELVQFADRRGQMEVLTGKIRELRPAIPLPWLGGRDPP